MNRDTHLDTAPQWLCAQALPKFLAERDTQKKFPVKIILMSKADVSDAFRNLRVDPDEAHSFCYILGKLVVSYFRLNSRWSGLPGFWDVM